uniref:Secreted protein n=1 Tax=Ditylum brightwellii TaxID=49249 RepID=A0A7S4RGP1_9STRA
MAVLLLSLSSLVMAVASSSSSSAHWSSAASSIKLSNEFTSIFLGGLLSCKISIMTKPKIMVPTSILLRSEARNCWMASMAAAASEPFSDVVSVILCSFFLVFD